MREKEALAVLHVLRAQTVAQRVEGIRLLRGFASKMPFFGAELATMQGEAEMASEGKTVLPAAALYEIADPSLRNDRLQRVAPGPDTVLPAEASALVAEWVTGWLRVRELVEAGVAAPGPLLLHGPPGVGKTATTRMVARQFDGQRVVVSVEAMSITDSHMGETTARLLRACQDARKAGAVIVIEEADTMTSARLYDQAAGVENARITTAVMRIIEQPGPTILTTNRLDVLNELVRRRCEFIIGFPEATPETRRTVIARELGTDDVREVPLSVPLTLNEALPLARRARRRAILENVPASVLFLEMVNNRLDVSECPF